jgi:ABC-2 type transport system ATP-binding protein
LLTTQYLDEADQLAGRLVILDEGRVIADGTPEELKAMVGQMGAGDMTRRPTLDDVFLTLTDRATDNERKSA